MPPFMNCYRCGKIGHTRADCPEASSFPPPSLASGQTAEIVDKPAWMPPPVPDIKPGHPPTAEYLAVKTALGFPDDGNNRRLLQVKCPWCEAGKGEWCMNRALGRRKDRAHEARYVAALAPIPAGIPGADLAMEQLADMRGARETAEPV